MNIVKQPFPFVLLQGGREEKELQRLGVPARLAPLNVNMDVEKE
jgi:hypothetical protein